MHPSDDRAALKAARKALRRCQEENAALRRQLIRERKARVSHPTKTERHGRPYRSSDPQKCLNARLHARGRYARYYDRKSYPLFLLDIFTDSAFFLWWSRAWSYARRIRLARTVVLVLALLLAATQTGTLFVLLSAIYLTLLPFLLAGIGICLTAALLHTRAVNRRLRSDLDGRHIRVLFPTRSLPFNEHAQPFFFASVRAMAAEPNTAVVIVSPHLLSPISPYGRHMFVTARRETEQIYLVRSYYYFTLRRRILDVVDPHLSILY